VQVVPKLPSDSFSNSFTEQRGGPYTRRRRPGDRLASIRGAFGDPVRLTRSDDVVETVIPDRSERLAVSDLTSSSPSVSGSGSSTVSPSGLTNAQKVPVKAPPTQSYPVEKTSS
jgi:hypothetical protein